MYKINIVVPFAFAGFRFLGDSMLLSLHYFASEHLTIPLFNIIKYTAKKE